MTSTIVIGVTTRTGSAVAIALRGTPVMPQFAGRREIELVPPGLVAQPYHAAAEMDLAAARALIAEVESAAEKAAAAGLRTLAATRPPSPVRAVAVVVKAVSIPGDLAGILRSHAWMHAAEGVLYREAVLAGAARCGWMAHALEQSALPTAEQAVNALGRAAGRPWRRFEKDAARAALALLATAADSDGSQRTAVQRDALVGGEIVATTGVILQELLQGVIPERARTQIVEMFAALEYHTPSREDHVAAAGVRNTLRGAGVQVGTIDALIAHLAIAGGHRLLTTDDDFRAASRHIGLQLWQVS